MKLKKNDNIIVIAGKDKGKTGKIASAFPKESKVVIDGINMKKVHRRPTKQDQKGEVIDVAMPIHVSNIQLVDPKTNKPTRIGKKIIDGKNVRVAKKSATILT